MEETDVKFMREAIAEARRAEKKDEVPVGAVVVKGGKVIARAHNLKERGRNATYHAEMLAIRKACKRVGDWRMEDCTLYVTLEPCPMCAGAVVNSRFSRVVFGAYDPKAGACRSLYGICDDARLNHRAAVTGGVLEEECGKILTDYFRRRRGAVGKRDAKPKV